MRIKQAYLVLTVLHGCGVGHRADRLLGLSAARKGMATGEQVAGGLAPQSHHSPALNPILLAQCLGDQKRRGSRQASHDHSLNGAADRLARREQALDEAEHEQGHERDQHRRQKG